MDFDIFLHKYIFLDIMSFESTLTS
jgi:hypothetical protein